MVPISQIVVHGEPAPPPAQARPPWLIDRLPLPPLLVFQNEKGFESGVAQMLSAKFRLKVLCGKKGGVQTSRNANGVRGGWLGAWGEFLSFLFSMPNGVRGVLKKRIRISGLRASRKT
jgi:hypothetical protein